eukprot:1148194-Amphidinium_carterae.1
MSIQLKLLQLWTNWEETVDTQGYLTTLASHLTDENQSITNNTMLDESNLLNIGSGDRNNEL